MAASILWSLTVEQISYACHCSRVPNQADFSAWPWSIKSSNHTFQAQDVQLLTLWQKVTTCPPVNKIWGVPMRLHLLEYRCFILYLLDWLKNLSKTKLWLWCMTTGVWVCACTHAIHVKVRGQLCGVGSLLPSFCAFQGLNWGQKSCTASTVATESSSDANKSHFYLYWHFIHY